MHGWTSEIRFVLRTFFPGNGIGVSGNSCKVNNIRPAIGAQYFFYEYPKNGGFSSSGNFTTSIFITQRNIQGDTMKARVIIITLIFSLLISLGLSAQVQQNSFINLPDSPIQVFAEVETGFVKVLSHTFQSGDTGTNFNFVTQGGQEILFPFQRVTLGANLGDRHLISALYQPLTIETEVTFRDDVTIDGVLFESDSSDGNQVWISRSGVSPTATISSPMKTWMCTAAWPCSCATLLSYLPGNRAKWGIYYGDHKPEPGTGAGPVHRSGLHPSLGYRAEF
jgi:hypothetical protein